jgi:hypothetical protein
LQPVEAVLDAVRRRQRGVLLPKYWMEHLC